MKSEAQQKLLIILGHLAKGVEDNGLSRIGARMLAVLLILVGGLVPDLHCSSLHMTRWGRGIGGNSHTRKLYRNSRRLSNGHLLADKLSERLFYIIARLSLLVKGVGHMLTIHAFRALLPPRVRHALAPQRRGRGDAPATAGPLGPIRHPTVSTSDGGRPARATQSSQSSRPAAVVYQRSRWGDRLL